MFTTALGLPLEVDLPAGMHRIPVLKIFNATYTPCYVFVKKVSDTETKVTAYGMQPHCMQNL